MGKPTIRRLSPQEFRNIRLSLFLSQQELAGAMDVTRWTIIEWETGRRKLPMTLL